MEKIPVYMEDIIKELYDDSSNQSKMYSLEWLNEWLDKKKIENKYGKEWTDNQMVLRCHNLARGYAEAVRRMYLKKMKKLPETVDSEEAVLAQKVSQKVDAVIRSEIHRYFSEYDEACY